MTVSMRSPQAPRRRAPGPAGIALLGLVFALSACQKNEDRSAGQKLDDAIARTQQAATDVANRAETLGADARAKVEASEPAIQKGYDKLKEAARDTGAAVSSRVSDAAITASVSTGLAKDPAFKRADHIDVQT